MSAPESPPSRSASFVRRRPAWTALVVLFGVLVVGAAVLLANLQSLRGPLQRTASAALQRDVTLGDLRLRWNGRPIVQIADVTVANLPGGSEPLMARLHEIEVSLAPLDLLRGRVFLPRIAVNDADVLLERLRDGRQNWKFGTDAAAKAAPAPGRVRIGGVSLARGRIRYVDATAPMTVTVLARTLDRAAQAQAPRSDAPPAEANDRYAMAFDIRGQYRGNEFSGQARSGGVVSLQDTGVPFPLQGNLLAGATRIQLEGTVADAAQLSGVDMQLRIAGPTLANLYPFLLLPLPASPPYDIRGRLRREGGRFAIDDLRARIGSTDLEGEGSYLLRAPRPLLTVQLRSALLDITDLGPLIGVETKTRAAKPDQQRAVRSREAARRADARTRGDRVLPAGRFDPARLRVIDAEVRLQARRVKGVAALALADFDAVLRLQDAVLKLDTLKLGVAGGVLVTRATLDARKGDALQSRLDAELRRLDLDALMPKQSKLAKGTGRVNAHASLRGTGNSIADVAAHADGRVAATMYEGRVSALVDAASGLALGRVLALLATGDREIKLNCGAAVFDVTEGQGKSSLFVFDTARTQVVGSGSFDLDHERFSLHVEPKPKEPGLLSARTPVNVTGNFTSMNVSLEKEPLIARAGAALALAALAPPAALLAFIETGPGEDTPCGEVLRAAGGEKGKSRTAEEGR